MTVFQVDTNFKVSSDKDWRSIRRKDIYFHHYDNFVSYFVSIDEVFKDDIYVDYPNRSEDAW